MIYNSIIDTVGNTPIVKLERMFPNASVYAKVEYFNPAGSVKDRAALYMIREAERLGNIQAGGTLIAPTSGNTGIGLCAMGRLMGYKVVLTMPESMSRERVALLRAYGGEVILTPAGLGMQGSVDKAEELAKSLGNATVIRQFDSKANALAHYETTGVEILGDLPDVDKFIAGIGTGGTVTGIARRLKETLPNVKIIGVEPKNSPLITEGKAGAHKIQGIGANFIPSVLELGLIDEVVAISDEDAYKYTRLLCERESLLCGLSSGAAGACADMIASRPETKG